MFNPLVDNLTLISDQELETKVNELSRKYFQTRNPEVQMQISTIIEMYKTEIQIRRSQKNQNNQPNDENGLDNLINIS